MPSRQKYKKKVLLNIFFFISLVVFTSINFAILISIFSSGNPELIYVSDFVSFLTGSSILSSGNAQNIYNLETQKVAQLLIKQSSDISTLLPFRSLPFLALLFKPFLSYNLITAYKTFLIINFGFVIIFTYFSGEIFPNLKRSFYWFLIPFAFFPFLHGLFLGQISSILLVLTLAIYFLLKNKKDTVSGILSAFLLIKFQYLTMVPMFFLLSGKKRKFLIGFLVTFSILALININLVGLDTIIEYPHFLSSTETGGFGSRPVEMFSLGSFLLMLSKGSISFSDLLISNLLVYLFMLWIFYKNLKKVKFNDLFIFIILTSLFFGIHVLDHDLMILLVPIYILINEYFKSRKEKGLLIISIVLFMLPFTVFINAAFIFASLLIMIAFYMIIPKNRKALTHLFNYFKKVK